MLYGNVVNWLWKRSTWCGISSSSPTLVNTRFSFGAKISALLNGASLFGAKEVDMKSGKKSSKSASPPVLETFGGNYHRFESTFRPKTEKKIRRSGKARRKKTGSRIC